MQTEAPTSPAMSSQPGRSRRAQKGAPFRLQGPLAAGGLDFQPPGGERRDFSCVNHSSARLCTTARTLPRSSAAAGARRPGGSGIVASLVPSTQWHLIDLAPPRGHLPGLPRSLPPVYHFPRSPDSLVPGAIALAVWPGFIAENYSWPWAGDRASRGWRESCLLKTGNKGRKERKPRKGRAEVQCAVGVGLGAAREKTHSFPNVCSGTPHTSTLAGRGLSACFSCGVHCEPVIGCFRDLTAQERTRRPPRTASGPSLGRQRSGFQRCPRVKLHYIPPGNEVLQVSGPQPEETALATSPGPAILRPGLNWLAELGEGGRRGQALEIQESAEAGGQHQVRKGAGSF